MAKLPKALIKKYGISKKAWSIFRGKSKVRKVVTKVVNPMARRFFKRRSAKRYSHGTGGISPMKIAVSAAAYGAFRSKIHSFIPDTGIPYSDNIIAGAVGYYLSKKSGWMKNAGVAILAVEAASVGNAMLGNTGSTNTAMVNY